MTLPGWLEPLLDAAAQREVDRWAIEERGVPGVELMERAGGAVAGVALQRGGDGRVAVVCGKGNNGGDGLVAARRLRDAGREVDVLLLAAPGELRGDPLTNLGRLPGPAPRPFEPAALDGAAVIVDAALGTGFSGAPRGRVAQAIEAMDAAGAPVRVAVDVPSGVDASTGAVHGAALRATDTVTFHAAKPGLWIAPGKWRAGRVTVVDIGIPPGAPAAAATGLIGRAVLDRLPPRGPQTTKFRSGTVLVCGGSAGLTGAPCLAAEAAMRAGAGYVTVCVPASLSLVFELRLLEAMSVSLPDRDGSLTAAAVEPVLERARRGGALVLGCGIGRRGEAPGVARELAARCELPLVLDADGLNAHAGELERLRERGAPAVLTPHAGELGRLLGIPADQVEAERLASVRRAAEAAGAVVVLKGDDTLVCDPEGRVGVSRGATPALATAGTGDVLAGVVGALLARGLPAFAAACAAVLAHAQAGRAAARRLGEEGVLARDVIAALPRALAREAPA